MLPAFALLLVFLVFGEALSRFTGIPVPGAVLGMMFLLLAFLLRENLVDAIRPTASVLLANLALLFVPAGVGIIEHGELFLHEGIGILVTLLASTVIAMLATAWTILWVEKRLNIQDDGED